MIVARSIAELTDARAAITAAGRSIALVPTMGALHAGHESLVGLARSHADAVVVSIFVNPLQFGPNEDYARYPRREEGDLEILRRLGVDVVFLPTVAEIYPAGRQVTVSAGALGTILEGESRPGHFDGVLTVVTKLFNLVRPAIAVFGEKDAQQLVCIRRMVVDLNVPVLVIGAPIVRESDGLAMSSRNRFLSVPERAAALALSTALRAGAAERTPAGAYTAAGAVLAAEPSIEVDYLTLVQPGSLIDVPGDYVGEALLMVAARVGGTRLIDNTAVTFTGIGADEDDLSAAGAR